MELCISVHCIRSSLDRGFSSSYQLSQKLPCYDTGKGSRDSDALNAEGRDIDIILAEVDLPVTKGLKLLKYIMRDEELRRIPIIMMSAQDEVSVVVKCLKHGAADYLVKPLCTNELLNLWTHMRRRRHMLGLSEKKILNYDFDPVASDPSDANTNSTTLFSDDKDDKSRRSTILKNSISNQREHESEAAASLEPALNISSENHLHALRRNGQTAQFSSCPKKTQLKIGESSAFLTYVKSSIPPSTCQRIGFMDESASQAEQSNKERNSCHGVNQQVQMLRDIGVKNRETTTIQTIF